MKKLVGYFDPNYCVSNSNPEQASDARRSLELDPKSCKNTLFLENHTITNKSYQLRDITMYVLPESQNFSTADEKK